MNDRHTFYLEQIRNLASQLNKRELKWQAVINLFSDMTHLNVMNVLLRFMKDFLSTSDDTVIASVTHILEDVRSLEELENGSQRALDILQNRGEEPGMPNFLEAVRILALLPELESRAVFVDSSADVLAEVLTAILHQAWGHKNRELWDEAFWGKSSDSIFILARHFWQDPMIKEMYTSQWLQIADEIEKQM